jgi:hypothetical protein
MQKWGTSGRWSRHILESQKENSREYHYEINKAIREHGVQAFEVNKICDCLLDDIDAQEQHYIKEFNTLHPNGYNMTRGGKDGGHCEASIEKCSEARKQRSEAIKQKISASKMGKRSVNSVRKREEDEDLPKYITRIRENNIVVGYAVKNFPMGIEKKERVSKSFGDRQTPERALERAKAFVNELSNKFQSNLDAYQKAKEETRMAEEQAKILALPKNVYPIIKDEHCLGYYVDGLMDFEGNRIPKRTFSDFTNSVNLDHVTKFIKLVANMIEEGKGSSNWLTIELPKNVKTEAIPNHIRTQYYKGQESGYRVDYFLRYDANKKQIVESKCFTSKKLTMERKLELAKDYVAKLDGLHKKSENERPSS